MKANVALARFLRNGIRLTQIYKDVLMERNQKRRQHIKSPAPTLSGTGLFSFNFNSLTGSRF